MAASKKVTNLLVLGKTGVGKSSSANTLLGRRAFVSGQSTTSVTQKCQYTFGEVEGRKIKVVDMPGLFDASLGPDRSIQLVLEKAMDALAQTPGGYDAILPVIKFGRLTEEDKQTNAILKAIFGKQYLKQHAILVVAFADLYDPSENDCQTIEEWCSKQEGDFAEVVQECGGRVVFFQNKTNDNNIKKEQLEKLFAMVEKVKADHKYTPQLFEAAKIERASLALQQKAELVTQETEAEIDLIFQEMARLSERSFAEQVIELEILEKRVDNLMDTIQNEDNGTGNLRGVINTLRKAKGAVHAEIKAAEQGQPNVEMRQQAEIARSVAEKQYQILKSSQSTWKTKLGYTLLGIAIGLGVSAAIYVAIYGVPVAVAGLAKAAVIKATVASKAAANGAVVAGKAAAKGAIMAGKAAAKGAVAAGTAVENTEFAQTPVSQNRNVWRRSLVLAPSTYVSGV